MPEAPYKIMAEPLGSNDEEKNTGGIVIYLLNGRQYRQEVSRVGYARQHTKNKKVDFEAQLEIELSKARFAVKILNEQLDGSGELL